MTEELLLRSFAAEWVADGRTVVGRAVPYGITEEVADRPGGGVYRERFELGAFKRAVKAPHHVELDYEHGRGILDVIGPGITLEERDDGLWGSWRALETQVGDQALALIDAGILRGLSVSFRPLGPGRRDPDGTVVRTACHLDRVALCREPAYPDAQVVAVRHKLERPDRDTALDTKVEALRQLGVLS